LCLNSRIDCANLMATISLYIVFNSSFVVSRCRLGISTSYPSKLSSESSTLKCLSPSWNYIVLADVCFPAGHYIVELFQFRTSGISVFGLPAAASVVTVLTTGLKNACCLNKLLYTRMDRDNIVNERSTCRTSDQT